MVTVSAIVDDLCNGSARHLVVGTTIWNALLLNVPNTWYSISFLEPLGLKLALPPRVQTNKVDVSYRAVVAYAFDIQEVPQTVFP